MFDKEFLKANNIFDLQKSIDKILNNEKHMRILRLMQTIKTEVDSRIFYYDRDYGSDPTLFYQKETEETMLSLESDIRKAVAVIIQEIDQEEETPDVG